MAKASIPFHKTGFIFSIIRKVIANIFILNKTCLYILPFLYYAFHYCTKKKTSSLVVGITRKNCKCIFQIKNSLKKIPALLFYAMEYSLHPMYIVSVISSYFYRKKMS